MGAGTFHPHTFFRSLGADSWGSVYVQSCRRPIDGRYGKSPNRLQHYYQLQVLLKPAPSNILDLYLNSLQHIGIKLKQNDIGLYEDNWKSPTLGAWGLGWEVRANGEEITQFTYFQELAGLPVEQVPCELTYGLERLYMYTYGYNNILDIPFNEKFTYGDIFYQNENQFSEFNFKTADTKLLFSQFDLYEKKVKELCGNNLSLPAYDYVLDASHAFNLLDSRGAISVTERQRFLGRVRDCAKICAHTYIKNLSSSKSVSENTQNTLYLQSELSSYEPKVNSTKTKRKLHSDKTVDIVFEIGVEEMPPSFQKSAEKSLLEKFKLYHGTLLNTYSYSSVFVDFLNKMETTLSVSARRIVFHCKHVPQFEPEQTIDLWGPAERVAKDDVGMLTKAGLGFCKKQNLKENEVSIKKNPKTNIAFLYAKKTIPSSDFPTKLISEFKKMVYQLDAPIKMHWLPKEEQMHNFIRPVRWIVCLIDNTVFPVDMFGIQSSSFTYGQRILSPAPISLNNTTEYFEKLINSHVYVESTNRKNNILKQISDILGKLDKNIELISDDDLLAKCVGLTESPFVFLGKFESKYLQLPPKLISSVLKTHMNYFSLWDTKSKQISTYYIGVANYKCTQIKSMILGTQKVVTSRLEDGAFYFDSDLATPIESLRVQLKNQVFQDDLGSLFDKSERLSIFTKSIAKLLNAKRHSSFSEDDIEILQNSGQHCKNDLKTGCVQEFPDELQGVMGGVLVRAQNTFQDKSKNVAQAIEEHYFPINAHAPLPSTRYALLLALADKLDSLILFLSVGFDPKGSHDPFGLRRLAIAIARILNLKHEQNTIPYKCSIDELIKTWHEYAGKQFHINSSKIKKFFVERAKSILREEFETNHVESISKVLEDFPVSNAVPLLKSLQNFVQNSDCLTAYKRARSMTQHVGEGQIYPKFFVHESEHRLYSVLCTIEQKLKKYFDQEDFEKFFQELLLVNPPLAEFFDSVLVNDENLDIRQNRLQLLLKTRKLYECTIDLSVIQVTHQNEKL